MERQDNSKPFAWWHSLMYATGILLLVCGIPATLILAFVFTGDRTTQLDGSDALKFGVFAVAAEVVIAVTLLFIARRISRARQRV